MVHPHSSISALRRPNSAGQGVLGAGGPKLRARPQRPEDQARLGDHQDRGELTVLGSNLFLLNLISLCAVNCVYRLGTGYQYQFQDILNSTSELE